MTPQKIVLKGKNGKRVITLKTEKNAIPFQPEVGSTKQIQNRTALSKKANAQVSGCPTWDTAVHRLRTPFFIGIPTFRLEQKIWADKLWGIWGILG